MNRIESNASNAAVPYKCYYAPANGKRANSKFRSKNIHDLIPRRHLIASVM